MDFLKLLFHCTCGRSDKVPARNGVLMFARVKDQLPSERKDLHDSIRVAGYRPAEISPWT